ncbi:MAG: flavoprotein [Gemmatimonadetes bacterium]|nr:flavoprotein [Gemmatimonadota bacterium]
MISIFLRLISLNYCRNFKFMRICAIKGSLNPQSRSSALIDYYLTISSKRGINVDLIDLRQHILPFHDGTKNCKTPKVMELAERIMRADGIVIATPIYVYGINANVKNFVDLTGRAWSDKAVGFLCSAGGSHSYMSILSLANSLMLDFRCLILPRFVFATRNDFITNDNSSSIEIDNPEVLQRIEELAQELPKLSVAAKQLTK